MNALSARIVARDRANAVKSNEKNNSIDIPEAVTSATNGDAQSKRKRSSVSIIDHPAKLHKPEILDLTENDEVSQEEDFDMKSGTDDNQFPARASVIADIASIVARIDVPKEVVIIDSLSGPPGPMMRIA